MPRNKSLSESARWFLEELQKTLDNFANAKGIQVVVIDKEGKLVSNFYGTQSVCKLILATEEGRIRCIDHFKIALSIVKIQKKAIFTECYAGFASLWVPIIIRGSLIGAIIGCGGKYEDQENIEKLKEKFSELANQLGVISKEDFLRAAIDETSVITKEEMEKRIEKVQELFDILSKTAHTPLKEVFG